MKQTSKPLDPCAIDRCRVVFVFGDALDVPRHIVRIDTRSTHGWQVRFRKPSKFFSDGVSRPSQSLNAAKHYLRSIYAPVPKKTSRDQSRRPPPVKAVGITTKRDYRGHWYVVATSPQKSKADKRFYFGNDQTRTPTREAHAFKRACAARKRLLAETPVPVR